MYTHNQVIMYRVNSEAVVCQCICHREVGYYKSTLLYIYICTAFRPVLLSFLSGGGKKQHPITKTTSVRTRLRRLARLFAVSDLVLLETVFVTFSDIDCGRFCLLACFRVQCHEFLCFAFLVSFNKPKNPGTVYIYICNCFYWSQHFPLLLFFLAKEITQPHVAPAIVKCDPYECACCASSRRFD